MPPLANASGFCASSTVALQALFRYKKMPRTKPSAGNAKPAETIKPVEPEEQVDLDDDPEEEMEEEVEYEEVEEEVEEEEEEEEVVEEELEEEEREAVVTNGTAADATTANATVGSDGGMKVDEKEDESEMHSDLLALPPHGSEVYIGGIPHDVNEEELRKLCEPLGEVAEVRVMKGKDSSENKGYAFVTFRTKELAENAIDALNNTDLKGKKIKCSTSQAKHRLFIGHIPRSLAEDDLKKLVTDVGPGVTKVDLMKDPNDSSRNRGFAFIEYYNHACADYSRKKMSTPKFKLDDTTPTVSWADPKSDVSSSNSQIKAVYVKNLPKDVSEDQLKKLFEHHGEITRVVIPLAKSGQENRFGFVHFAARSTAMKALENTEKYEINGQALECSLAKPPGERRGDTGHGSNNKKGGLLPSHRPRAGYGVMGGGYSASPGFAPPMIYGRGHSPAGMAMVPMVLPDGRLAYLLQQPGLPMAMPQRGGGSSGGGRRSGDGNRGRRYQPY